MNQLVFIENNKVVTDSLTVAEVFNKRHSDVIRDVETQINKLHEAGEQEFGKRNFALSSYQSGTREYKKYNLTEDAFTLVAMAYTTPEAMKMKVKFIQEFKRMREHIEQHKVKVLDERTALIQSLKLTAETAERTDQLEKVVNQQSRKILEIENKVEEQITLDHGEQRRLQKAVASKVYELSDDPKERSRLFREIYREIKDRFAVASYKDVKRKELQAALNYIENWVPRKVS